MGKIIQFHPSVSIREKSVEERGEARRKINLIKSFSARLNDIQKLKNFFKDASPQVRLAAITAAEPSYLKEAFQERTLELIRPLLHDSIPRIRKSAATVIAGFNDDAGLRALLERLVNEKHPGVENHLENLIHSSSERTFFPVLEEASKDKSEKVRLAARKIIEKRVNEEHVLQLFEENLQRHEKSLEKSGREGSIVSHMDVFDAQMYLELLGKAGILSQKGRNVLRVIQNSKPEDDPTTAIARLKIALLGKKA